MATSSPFLQSTSQTTADSLAIVHLSRDNLVPVILECPSTANDDYAEGAVLNSRFGSFPHSTLIGVPWGSQVRASAVDTGSRGRKRKAAAAAPDSAGATPDAPDTSELKRKRENAEETGSKRQKSVAAESPGTDQPDLAESASQAPAGKVRPAVTAASGFVHILKPSPELWTVSLPHRTQVVYTPDYSYILQRIRAFPGKTLIEAGAGSGSFTHASARAVFNGFSSEPKDGTGRVYSFEFHQTRFEKMRQEISDHGLDGVVHITHRDVYKDGFNIDGKSPKANAVFLDLPAPWDALHHLSRQRPTRGLPENWADGESSESWVSPLDPEQSVHICTFSPCIEQVTRTIEVMRELGWVEIEMVEVAHRKLFITRERVGISGSSQKGVMQAPGDVTEAVARLKAINTQLQDYHAKDGRVDSDADVDMDVEDGSERAALEAGESVGVADTGSGTPAKPWKEGRLIHRPDTEMKTHTSYLVFAILPREWTEEQEAEALARWPVGKETGLIGALDKATRKNLKREQMDLAKKKKKEKREKKVKANAEEK